MKCIYLEKTKCVLPDSLTGGYYVHNAAYCNNRNSERHNECSIDNCSVCKDCPNKTTRLDGE